MKSELRYACSFVAFFSCELKNQFQFSSEAVYLKLFSKFLWTCIGSIFEEKTISFELSSSGFDIGRNVSCTLQLVYQ